MFKSTLSLVACATLVASLEANTLQLEPIVISASKTEQSLKETTSNIDIITAEQLEEGHYSSVIDALNTLSGISFTQSGGLGQQSSLFVRGFSNKYTLVLIDGMRANDVSNFEGAFFDQLSINDIERIEVIKGAQSGIWGADASAGVINLVTKKAKPHHINAYMEAGSYHTKKFGASLSHVIDRGDIKIGFDRILSDGFSAAEPKKSNPLYGNRFDDLGWERDAYDMTSLHAKAGINLTDNDRLEFAHRYLSSTVNFDSSGTDQPYPIVSSMWGTTYYQNTFTQRFTNASYSHKDTLNTFTIHAGRSEFERNYYGGYKGETDEIGITNTLKYSDAGTLVMGISRQTFDLSTVAGSDINKEYTGDALFASNTNLFNSGSTVISETLRYDDFSIFGNKITGKIGIKQTLENSSISVNYGSAFQAPNLSDIYYPWGIINENLKPESIRSFDITGTYHNFRLTYFYNTIRDMIAANSDYSQMINIDGKSILQGYEATLKQPIGDSFVINGAYTRLHAVDGSGKELARRPHETLKGSADWYPSEKLHTGVNAEYIGTRYDNNAKTVETGKYSVFGAVMNYTFNQNIDLYIKLDNIFDRYYQSVDGYATAGRSGYLGMKINY